MMFKDKSRIVIQKLKSANKSALISTAELYKKILIHSMETTPRDKSRTYYDIKGKAVHHPSEPRHPPAPLSRELINSIEVDQVEDNEVWASTDVEYALELERGRIAGESPMEARPAWKPAMDKNRKILGQQYINTFRSEVD